MVVVVHVEPMMSRRQETVYWMAVGTLFHVTVAVVAAVVMSVTTGATQPTRVVKFTGAAGSTSPVLQTVATVTV